MFLDQENISGSAAGQPLVTENYTVNLIGVYG